MCLINIQNFDDTECFKWCLVRHLHPANYNLARITKVDKDFLEEFDLKKIPIKIKDIIKKIALATVSMVMKYG